MTIAEMQSLIRFTEDILGYKPYMICVHSVHHDALSRLIPGAIGRMLSLDVVEIRIGMVDTLSFYFYGNPAMAAGGVSSKVYSIAGALATFPPTPQPPTMTGLRHAVAQGGLSNMTPSGISHPGQVLPAGTGAFQGRSLKIPLDYNADANVSGIDYAKQTCSHTWQQYNGLRESYQFCTKCDEKRTAEEGEAEDAKYKEMYDTINNIWRPS